MVLRRADSAKRNHPVVGMRGRTEIMGLLSVVVPCYNEQEAMPLFYGEMCKVMASMQPCVDFEILFISDGSDDRTLQIAKALNDKDSRVKYIAFSRNFGKEAAIYAGLEKAKGDFVAIMDVDLQDPPELLAEMYKGITRDGQDCIAARRVTRKGEPPIRSFFAREFYALFNKVAKIDLVDGARDYRLMTREMVDSILSLKEHNRFSKGIFSWVGYNTQWLEYENVERAAGETKWSFWKLLLYSLDGVVAFSTAPLAIASFVGFALCLLALIFVCIIVFKTLVWGDPVSGYPSMICVVLFIGGIQLFSTGIVGEYLSKVYIETKNRPIYIIKEEV